MSDLNIIKPQKVQNIIDKFCYTIGMIPTSYKVALTYEEQILAIGNYLETTVYPAINNNAEALSELQNLFIDLKNYVDNYFDNLDVQEEIDTKINNLVEDGTMSRIINQEIFGNINNQINQLNTKTDNLTSQTNKNIEDIEEINENQTFFTNSMNNNFNNLQNNVNNQLSSLNNKIDNLANATPIPVSSISAMTDTSKIYVNTTDGKWYFYNGSEWVIGGTYQATEISEGSIDLLLLDDNLQQAFNYKTTNLDLTSYASNQYMMKNGKLNGLTGATVKSFPLQNNKMYIFTGYDDALLCSLVIKNASNQVVFVSNPSNLTRKYGKIFVCKENNLTAYISTEGLSDDILVKHTSGILAEITNISPNNNDVSLIKEINGRYLQSVSIAPNQNIATVSATGYKTKIFRMIKGQNYNIKSYDNSFVCGLLLLDFNFNILYASSTENVGNTRREIDYNFKANYNGFIIISYSNSFPAGVILTNNKISNIYGKRIGFLGDSISAGVGDAPGGYGLIISNKNHMIYENKSVGGATITSGTVNQDNSNRFWINEHITDLNQYNDYIVLEGGVNDSSLGVPLGTITENYNDTLDTNTFCGAFENMLKQLITRFKGKKYGYLFVHQMSANFRITNNPSTSYYYMAKKCCEKWGVPYLDLNDKVPPFGMFYSGTAPQELLELKSLYTNNGDGWHPTLLGYQKYYVDKIETWLNSL